MNSSATKIMFGFVLGGIVGTGVSLAVLATQTSNDTAEQLALNNPSSSGSSKIGETTYPPMPPCTPPAEGPNNCPTPEQYQQYQQNQQQTQQQPNTGQYPMTNQTPPSGSTQNPPTDDPNFNPNQQPNNQLNQPGQNFNPNQNQSGQPGQQGQFSQPQPGQPFNAASTNIGPPPQLSFQRPAGLDDPDKCFRDKGGEALVNAVRGNRLTTAQAMSAASCFSGNFNTPPGQGQPGQNNPNGQPGAFGQSGRPFGQMTIFSGEFIKTISAVKPPSNDCVVRVAGEAVADKMFGQGIQPDNETRDKIFKAGCFGPPPGNNGQVGPNGQQRAPGRQFAGPPLEAVDCLNKIAGNSDIQSGKRNPTPAEYSAGQACYAKANVMPFFVPPREVSENSPLALCAKAVIGVTDISSITPNSLTRDQKQRMRQCYAPSGEQAMANTQPSLPQEAADCIKKIMGEEVFAQVSTGKLEPSAEQRKAGAACFQKKTLSKIAELSEAAVPLTQTQALMADIDANLVSKPTVVPPTATEVSNDPDSSTFELTGTLGEDADVETVDIYYNSDANIVTTETKDSDTGKKTWSTKVAYSSLSQDEQHTLYAVMTKSDGTVVRSPLVAFAAEATASDDTTAIGAISRNMLILYGALGVLILTVISFIIIRRRHKVAV